MVFHIVLFRPRSELTERERQLFLDALTNAAQGISSVRGFRVGRRITHGRGYEKAMGEDFPYVAVIEFEDVAGLKEYLEHPVHVELGARFQESSEAALIYDYEDFQVELLR